ncbi:MAG: hypothetical protein QFX35_01240 [Candidatus Verstraetearchaeota archaeon]|nr:hypothetical protein [Candidatus Verstraetearchaeota archaeon]
MGDVDRDLSRPEVILVRNGSIPKVVVFTPTYHSSPGIRYRVDMMLEALRSRYDVRILKGDQEKAFRGIYRILGPIIIGQKPVWDLIGRRIAKQVMQARPDAAILITDVTAGAARYLTSKGVATFLSIEDLTPEWLGGTPSDGYTRMLRSLTESTEGVIAVSQGLREKLLSMGIDSCVVPPGLDKVVMSEEESLNRMIKGVSLVSSGKLQFKEEEQAFLEVCRRIDSIELWSYDQGRLAKRLKRRLRHVRWYSYPTLGDAIGELRQVPIGLLVRYRASCPTRIYLHASLLQPIIAIGDGWTGQVAHAGIGVVTKPEGVLESINGICERYARFVSNVKRFAGENLLEKAYKPLLDMLDSAL